MKEELKKRMLEAIGSYPNALIISIAENCAQVAVDFYKEREKPLMEKYGYRSQSGLEDLPSGWMFEGGEEAYYEALKEWAALHSTFDDKPKT